MASGDIQVLSRTIAVAPNLTRRDATYIGDLDDGYSMIDLNGQLPARDRGDYYRFRMTQAGGLKATLPGSSDDDPKPAAERAVRFQLLNFAGRGGACDADAVHRVAGHRGSRPLSADVTTGLFINTLA